LLGFDKADSHKSMQWTQWCDIAANYGLRIINWLPCYPPGPDFEFKNIKNNAALKVLTEGWVQRFSGEDVENVLDIVRIPQGAYQRSWYSCDWRLLSLAELAVEPAILARVPTVVARDGTALRTYSDSAKWLKKIGSGIQHSETDTLSVGFAVAADGTLLNAEDIDFAYDPDEEETAAQDFLKDHQMTPLSERGGSGVDDNVCSFPNSRSKSDNVCLDSFCVPPCNSRTARRG
jgi:hypothetical protein